MNNLVLWWILIWGLAFVSSAMGMGMGMGMAVGASNYTDQVALLEFKSKLGFNPILDQNWTRSTNFCKWVGVSCSSRRQRVTSLSLTNMELTGSISPFIGNLSFLVNLNLGDNQLQGHLSLEVGRLYRLRFLILQNNQLQGSIPPSLSNCHRLQTISLFNNQFDNVIPEELGYLPNLRVLNLGGNKLRGPLPWTPSSINNNNNLSTTLQFLSLQSMDFTSFPPALFNMSSLLDLSLAENSISGEIPSDFCYYFPHLRTLNISHNQLSGELPREISQCQELRGIHLDSNNFHGSIPEELGTMPRLESINLRDNELNGRLPSALSNISTLRNVLFRNNNLQGNIPDSLGLLSTLIRFDVVNNSLTGVIPPSMFNTSSLQFFAISMNGISGHIPPLKLPNLAGLYLSRNQLSGNIPESISNSTSLTMVELAHNMLSGPVPWGIGNLRSLQTFNVLNNKLTNERAGEELNFLRALTNCRSLENLVIARNPFNGLLPYSIGNLSSSLLRFVAYACEIQGSIPPGIGSLEKLIFLFLNENNITGSVPRTIGELKSLQKLFLEYNKINDSIPDELCRLQNLGEAYLSRNNLSGPIPSCMYNITRLQVLDMSFNMLSSSIPTSLWSLNDVIALDLSSNSLSGEIPNNIMTPDSVEYIDLSRNMITGEIPSSFGGFRGLERLNLTHNLLRGSIPESLGGLVTLRLMDLSQNELTGNIPTSLESITSLLYLNLSYNKLSGQIPFRGPFAKFNADSFVGNQHLCQANNNNSLLLGVKACSNNINKKKSTRKKILLIIYIVPAISSLVIFSALLMIFLVLRRKYRAGNTNMEVEPADDHIHEHRMVSYAELVRATGSFSESNLLGSGSHGAVYKGILDADGTTVVVAVKVLNLRNEGAYKSFDAECRVLRSVRHRNLVKVITSCSNPEFRALILRYMPNGSLEKWLHTQSYRLDLIQRLRVMLDVALALEYLHHGQVEPVLHCDVKPSNVLLDDEMVAHLGDFGIAKILAEEDDQTFAKTKTLGTIGYMAPEYGSEGMVSSSGDVYSYGIMVMETMTGRRPTEEMFGEDRSLRGWVKEYWYRKSAAEVLDPSLSAAVAVPVAGKELDCCCSIIEVALNCSRDGPGDRITMAEVVLTLTKIKQTLLHP